MVGKLVIAAGGRAPVGRCGSVGKRTKPSMRWVGPSLGLKTTGNPKKASGARFSGIPSPPPPPPFPFERLSRDPFTGPPHLPRRFIKA